MNKKMIIMGLLLSLSLQANIVSAKDITNDMVVVTNREDDTIKGDEGIQGKATYMEITGVVTAIEDIEGQVKILIGDEHTNGILFIIEDSVRVIESKDLKWLNVKDIKIGMEVSIVIPKDTPMTMSLPAMCVAKDLIIVKTPNKFIEIGYFNDKLTNELNTLQLNINETTTIIAESGNRRRYIGEDLKNQELLVIYSASTRSIPAQTVPEFIVLMDKADDLTRKQNECMKYDTQQDTTKGIKIRELASKLGYNVEWVNKDKMVVLTRDDVKVQLIVGNKKYIYNNQERILSDMISLEENNVIVPSILERELR